MNRNSFEFIRKLLLDQTAISLDAGKQYLVEARLTPIARSHGLASIDQLVVQMQQLPNGRLVRDVVDAMTTNETFFFRDAVPFEALREVVLPDLFRRRASIRQLSIWSAACSTGQEPYSIAMLVRQCFAEYGSWNIRILGSDLSHLALQQAREGRYNSLEIDRGLSSEYKRKYFRPRGTKWQIVNEIREMVEFRTLNLVAGWPPLPKMDIILLRNVMVYFKPEAKKQIMQNVRQQLKSDGYLFLGGAETTIHLDSSFTHVRYKDYSYYQIH